MNIPLFDEVRLRQLAGDAAFRRGVGYHADGRVELTQVTDVSLDGNARGTETYALWLRRNGAEWAWHCDCPAAADGSFCKHLVAAVLTARDKETDDESDSVSCHEAKRPTREPDDLLPFLQMQPAARLAQWLHDFAKDDGHIQKRLLLYRATEHPEKLKSVLGKLLNTGGFLDYRRSMEYARRLEAAIKPLRDMLGRDPAECRALCEYALRRLIKVYGNADDSSGAIGECLQEIAGLHAEACAAAPPGSALARPLHDLKCLEDWNLLPLDRYWKALGVTGQAAYAKLVVAAFERLPSVATPDDRYGEAHGICRRAEELAKCLQDFELLQRVLRRDLSNAHDHLRVLESLCEFGREREALAWAELAVKQFPNDSRLRNMLADCLAKAGMDEEALEQTWHSFQQQPIDSHWDALKHMAGKHWPAWRGRALDALAAKEKGLVSVRIVLLQHDGDLAAATKLACENTVRADVLLKLAAALKRSDKATAGAFYLRLAHNMMNDLRGASDYARLVAYLKDASALSSDAQWRPVAAEARTKHARKPKLMGMLDKAGL